MHWGAEMGGRLPGLLHAGSYAATFHWLKAVKGSGINGRRCGRGQDEGNEGQRLLQPECRYPAARGVGWKSGPPRTSEKFFGSPRTLERDAGLGTIDPST